MMTCDNDIDIYLEELMKTVSELELTKGKANYDIDVGKVLMGSSITSIK